MMPWLYGVLWVYCWVKLLCMREFVVMRERDSSDLAVVEGKREEDQSVGGKVFVNGDAAVNYALA